MAEVLTNTTPGPSSSSFNGVRSSSTYASPLKFLEGYPSVLGVSSNQQQALPSDAFLSLDPVQESEPYTFGLGDHDSMNSLYGRDW